VCDRGDHDVNVVPQVEKRQSRLQHDRIAPALGYPFWRAVTRRVACLLQLRVRLRLPHSGDGAQKRALSLYLPNSLWNTTSSTSNASPPPAPPPHRSHGRRYHSHPLQRPQNARAQSPPSSSSSSPECQHALNRCVVPNVHGHRTDKANYGQAHTLRAVPFEFQRQVPLVPNVVTVTRATGKHQPRPGNATARGPCPPRFPRRRHRSMAADQPWRYSQPLRHRAIVGRTSAPRAQATTAHTPSRSAHAVPARRPPGAQRSRR
jgi:hypothetical protein